MLGSMAQSAAIFSAPKQSSFQTMGSFLSSAITFTTTPTAFVTCLSLMFFRRSILDKAAVLEKTCLVVQRAIMESNCLIDTELTLRATTANKLRYNGFLDWKR